MTARTIAHYIASESPSFKHCDEEEIITYIEEALELDDMGEQDLVELFR